MQRVGGSAITLLPGIELRTELGGKESVHLVGIFPEDCDFEDVWTKLQSLGISPADIAKKGPERVFVIFARAAVLIRELGGVVSVHAGRKSNSIEGISNAEEFKQSFKAGLLREHVDLLEVTSERDIAEYRSIVFPAVGANFALAICSDNHDIRSYVPRRPFWVRADRGFRGLLQLLNEPELRAYVGDEPRLLARVRDRPTKIIDTVMLRPTAARSVGQEWFDGVVPLNPGMVAIIGSKGGGKSALADTLALLGHSRSETDFSFLSKERFLAPRQNLGRMFEGTLRWASGAESTRTLADGVDRSQPELVKYLPQNYIERICTEFATTTNSTFDRELREVIYSHVDAADRLDQPTLTDLIAYLTEETEERIASLQGTLAHLNVEVVRLEDRDAPEYRARLEASLAQKLAELEAHDAGKPQVVVPPDADPQAQQESGGLLAEIEVVRSKIAELEATAAQNRSITKANAALVASAEKLLGRITNLDKQVKAFRADAASEASAIGVKLGDLINVTMDREPVLIARDAAAAKRRDAGAELDPSVEGTVANRLASARNILGGLQADLDGPLRRYSAYQEAVAAWESRRAILVGTAVEPESLEGLRALLASVNAIPAELDAKRSERLELVEEIYSAKSDLLAQYQRLFRPVQAFIAGHPVARAKSALTFEASIVASNALSHLLDLLHQGRKGSFAGDSDGRALLTELTNQADLHSAAGAAAFADLLAGHLWSDRREAPPRPVRMREQLRQNVDPESVYDFIFGLDYLQPRFSLMWEGRNLDQLSPGERGSLLLVFYLLIDQRDEPLVIDQPEENLDNETITALLVPAVRAARERRQLIVVTHSPNLAVVCDADQVIHAQIDRANGNQITYTTGAIENPGITPRVVDVLEGTLPAFRNRDAKYHALVE
jgi:energy-coupling factor transporter ATP-binding protein EcfA2